jgi:hypothetical protein
MLTWAIRVVLATTTTASPTYLEYLKQSEYRRYLLTCIYIQLLETSSTMPKITIRLCTVSTIYL